MAIFINLTIKISLNNFKVRFSAKVVEKCQIRQIATEKKADFMLYNINVT